MFKAVLFDLDNTLCDIVSARIRYANQVARASNVYIDPDELRTAAKDGTQSTADLLRNELNLPIGKTIPSYKIALCVEQNESARKTVSKIRSKVTAGVITNGRLKTQITKLKRTLGNISLSPVVVSGEIGCRKPDKRIFEHALTLLNLSADQVLFVGDDPIDDMLGASEAGINTCWLSHDRSPGLLHCAVDHIVKKIDELPELIHG